MSCVLGCPLCPEYIGGPRPPPNLLGEGVGVQVGLLPPTRLMEVESKLDSTFLSHTPRGGVGVQGGLLPPFSWLGKESPSWTLPSPLMAPRWRWSWTPPPPIQLGG